MILPSNLDVNQHYDLVILLLNHILYGNYFHVYKENVHSDIIYSNKKLESTPGLLMGKLITHFGKFI